jgi:broad specificity phosphatase PhoE
MAAWSSTELAEFAARQARLRAEGTALRRAFSATARAQAERFAQRLVREFGASRVILTCSPSCRSPRTRPAVWADPRTHPASPPLSHLLSPFLAS